MRLSSVSQAQQIDSQSQQVPGLSAEILMEEAGRKAAQWIEEKILSHKKINSVLFLIGPGNNGGDGRVVIRHIAKLVPQIDIMGPDKKMVGTINQSYDLIIDAFFGIGLNRNIEGAYAECIQSLASQKAIIVSLDTPSGLDADRGLPLGACVKADHTLTFGISKIGFTIHQGPEYTGRIHVLDIGFPRDLVKRNASQFFSLSNNWIRRYRPQFGVDANKSKRGRALLLAGSTEYPGAGILAARSCLRAGSGYVVLAQENPPFVSLEYPDFLVRDLRKTKLKDMKFDAAGIGPGFGVNKKTKQLIEELKSMRAEKVVIDADALTVCANENLFPLPSTWVATPHTGELSRILKVDAATIEKDRFHYAEEAQKKMGCKVVLKGFHPLVATEGKVIVVMTGNPALAKSGTGDVLTGMIVAFMAQGMDTLRATLMGCYYHGAVADQWIKTKDASSFMASDLIDGLPRTLKIIPRSL